jgi:PAS domain S-box-containing protein
MTSVTFEKAGELRDLLFTIIESMPYGLLLADRQGEVVASNHQALALLGLMGTSLQGRSCFELLQQAQSLPSAKVDELRRPGSRIAWETRGEQGRECSHLAVSRQELKSPFQGVSGFFLVVEDITYLAMMEARLSRQQRFAAMQELAAHMSQELKNPLGSMELYASVLKRELAGEPENERLAVQMLQAVRTMDHLLDNHTTFLNLPAPSFSSIDVSGWLEETAGKLDLLAQERGMTICRQYRHILSHVEGDGDLLQQLSLNLGLNALESMKTGGELQIDTGARAATAEHPGYLEVKFMDQGSGIAAGLVGKIFDPFFTTKDRAGGLGLAIVHHVAEMHGGLIEVTGRSGGGSVFTVLLPTIQQVKKG